MWYRLSKRLGRPKTKQVVLDEPAAFWSALRQRSSEEDSPLGSKPSSRGPILPMKTIHSLEHEAAGFCSSCGHLLNSAISNAPDVDGEIPFPKKRLPTIRTGFAVYLFIPQEATTGSSTSSLEPRSITPIVSEEALAAMVQVQRPEARPTQRPFPKKGSSSKVRFWSFCPSWPRFNAPESPSNHGQSRQCLAKTLSMVSKRRVNESSGTTLKFHWFLLLPEGR